MIVREAGGLPAALDRLLQVERITSLEPLPSLGDRSSDASNVRAGLSSAAPSVPLAGRAAGPAMTTPLLATLPLGESVTARVVDVPAANHVVADIGDLRIALAWPAASGLAPQPGQDVVLRVLAHEPVLLFQSIEADRPEVSTNDDDVHWSSDAIRLQTVASTAPARSSLGALRFDIPILALELEPPSSAGSNEPNEPNDRDRSSDVRRGEPGPTASPVTVERSPDRRAVSGLVGHAPDVALDDVTLGHRGALVNGSEAPLVPHLQDNGGPTVPFSPLVLQGPAWDGQPMELVVRRERDDELFDNPVLDHWCGEVTIDLPHLGRVAGHLSFSMQGLRVRIEGDDEHSVVTMSAASSELAAALAHADLRVSGLTVAGRSADMTRTDWGGGVGFGYGGRRG